MFMKKTLLCLIHQFFIFLMLRALYRMISKNVKSFFGENSLNVTNVKQFSKFFFGDLGVFLMSFRFRPLT